MREIERCITCTYLRPSDLDENVFMCPVVNIRIHVDEIHAFGCTLWENAQEKLSKTGAVCEGG